MVISWTNYLVTVIAFLLFYYFIVLILFYREDIKRRFQTGKLSVPLTDTTRMSFAGTLDRADEFNASSAAPMHSLVDELQAFVSQSGEQGTSKEELSGSLKILLQKYPAIKGSLFQEGITNLIAVISENNCAVHFSAEELSDLWKT